MNALSGLKQQPLVFVSPMLGRTYFITAFEPCMQAWPIDILNHKSTIATNSLSLSNSLPLVGTISAFDTGKNLQVSVTGTFYDILN